MIHLCYSNRTEALFERFASDLAAHRATLPSPLEPVRLVAPNRNVATWLKRSLARRDGIAANLELLYLRRFVSGLVAPPNGLPAAGGAGAFRLVDSTMMLDLVLELLMDEGLLSLPALEPVRRYLHAGGSARDAIDLRRVQLARELSRLYEEYAYARPEMLAAWARGERALGGVAAETEDWERALWQAALGPRGRAAARAAESGEQLLQLSEVVERIRPDLLAGGRPVFLFGVSYVAHLYQRLLARLAASAELYVYTLNPCLEFWEDLSSASELRRHARLPHRAERQGMEAVLAAEDPFGLAAGGETPALVLWGRPGRENVRLLNEIAACDFREAFADPLADGATLLRQLQRDILVREPERREPDPAFDFEDDRSLQILACPNAQREAEAVASEIWALVREDEEREASSSATPDPVAPGSRGADSASPARRLRFSDIAVLVAGPEPRVQLSHLEAAFTQRNFEIPFCVEESALAPASPVAEAADLLLGLPLGGFGRSEVLRAVTHPAIAGRFPDAEPAAWVRLCDALGVFHGADRRDLAGSYVDRDLHSWDQGLRRLALGTAMAGRMSGAAGRVEIEGEEYVVDEQSAGDRSAAARFGLLVRSLLADACDARGAERTAAEWSSFLEALLDTYLWPRDEDQAREKERCLQAVRELAALEIGDRRFGYRIARELVRAELAGVAARRPGARETGVTISTLQPMRALPFRVVFVMGLGEGRFPSATPRNTLDLRLAKPRPGDVNAREQDQYMFLETLLCARERLVLSYVARDELTGDALEPSPIVVELERMIRRGYRPWTPDAESPLRRRIRLRRFDEAEGPAPAPPEAQVEAQLARLKRRLAQQGPMKRSAEAAQGEGCTCGASEGANPASPEVRLSTADPARAGRGLVPRSASAGTAPGAAQGERAATSGWATAALEAVAASPVLREKLALVQPPSSGLLFRADTTLRLSLTTLRRFLECPLQAGARFLLRLEEDELDLTSQDDEAFETPKLEESAVLREAFEAIARAGRKPADALRDVERPRVAAGRLPVGFFAELEAARRPRVLAQWTRLVLEHLGAAELAPGMVRAVRFGGADSPSMAVSAEAEAVPDQLLDAVTLEIDGARLGLDRPLQIELHGRTSLLVRDETEALVLRSRPVKTGWQEWVKRCQETLAPFLDHVALCAAGRCEERSAVWLNAAEDGDGARWILRFAAIPRAEARDYLARLAEALVSGVHDYLLPAAAVVAAHDVGPGAGSDEEASFAEWVEKVMDERLASSRYGPIADPEAYAPPAQADAKALAQARFGLYFSSRQLDEPTPAQKAAKKASGNAPPPRKRSRASGEGGAA